MKHREKESFSSWLRRPFDLGLRIAALFLRVVEMSLAKTPILKS